ncbi:hypothetical protein HGRIS_003618 [Hohenbuehelia grisea]|uniref:Uncharacterized protein n=1 Tax=Hohenbuehelia grisea TaxID=104357 RepID=A0ABR3JH37_9AGAR
MGLLPAAPLYPPCLSILSVRSLKDISAFTMPAVLSKPSILALSEASATVAESGGHHIEVVVVVVLIAGFTIIFLACRAVIAYQARRNDGIEVS